MCSLPSLWCCPEIIPVLRAALKTFSRYSSLIVSFRPSPLPHPLTLDGWAGGNLHWTGNRYCGGHLNRFFYVLVPVSQEDWVRKASSFFHPFTPQIWLNFVHRTDSVIMTLMSYSINSGLLTR
jgi:hypothetical protein